MCLVASGMFHNRLCSDPDLLAITLSLLPAHFTLVAKDRIDNNYLSGLLKWSENVKTLVIFKIVLFEPKSSYSSHQLLIICKLNTLLFVYINIQKTKQYTDQTDRVIEDK